MSDPFSLADPKPPRRRSRRVLIVLMLAVIAGTFYRPPFAVLGPAPALDVVNDIKIDGIPVQKPKGRYLLVAVSLDQPNALRMAYAVAHPDYEVVPLASVVPKGVTDRQFAKRQRGLFDESRLVAAAAAARASGLTVNSTGKGAKVLGVSKEAPSRRRLRTGDVITSVDGSPISLATDLRPIISSKPAGSRFKLGLTRDGKSLEVSVRSADLPGTEETAPAIGIIVETVDFDIGLPFKIDFKHRDIGGPSAGLAYTLAIYDIIDQSDVARGRTIAASGTIQPDGKVGEVGGLNQKAVGAERAGARLFIVPRSEVGQAEREGIKIHGADDLEEALQILKAA